MTENDLRALPPLSIPYAPLRVRKTEKDRLQVFDRLRNKFVNLTPEEFVRQNFVSWLIDSRGYPAGLVANEVSLNLNGTKKRCDTIVYNRECNPLLIVEYKAPGIEISQQTFDQIVRYNTEFKAKYLVVTNGIKLYCCLIDYDNKSYNFIPTIPAYKDTLPGIGVNSTGLN